MNVEATIYRDFLLNSIPTATPKKGGSMVLCRCMECSDSRDPTHAHFYISIPKDEEEPSFFYCHKCHCGGIVTHSKLLKWGIYNAQIASYLIKHNKYCLSLPKNRAYNDREVYMLYNNWISENRMSELKLKYINDRLGTDLSYMDLIEKKIILNLHDVLNQNSVEKLTLARDAVNDLNDYFLGFISSDNAFVNMRRLVGEGKVNKYIDSRYMRYNIFGKYDNTEKFYIMPCNINANTPNRIKVNIAEGEFDILSIYYNLRKDANQIYASISGSGYEGLIRYLLSVLKLFYIELHVYPDNDIYGSNNVLYSIYRLVQPFGIPMYIHRNIKEGEKDFGVDISRIQESIIPMQTFI